jgi:hypothetical protein
MVSNYISSPDHNSTNYANMAIGTKQKYGPADFVQIAHKMQDLWSQPQDSLPLSKFLAIYAPNVVWNDHAFLIHREGLDDIAALRQRWLGANHPYTCVAKAVHPTSMGAVAEFVATGKFADDLGPITATGQEFQYRACLVLDISAVTGLIEKVEEYYTKLWHQSVDVSGYRGQPAVGEKK